MTARRVAMLAAVVVAVSACTRIPDESVALARLVEAETVATELIEAAVGPERVTPWERSVNIEGCPLICANCHEAASRMHLEGEFDLDEVMEAFAQAAEAAGGSVREVEQVGFSYWRRVFLTGPSRFEHRVSIFLADGAVRVVVGTGSPCYRVQE